MPVEESPFVLASPALPEALERRVVLRVILMLSAIVHVALLAFLSRSAPPPEGAPPRAGETVRVLRGEVTDKGEPGLRLVGYADVVVPASAKR